jgi:hypothetical protein
MMAICRRSKAAHSGADAHGALQSDASVAALPRASAAEQQYRQLDSVGSSCTNLDV